MTVRVDRGAGGPDVRVVSLDRPAQRNALDHHTLYELRDALADAVLDECRVLVLNGSGDHFCAGADLSDVEDEGFVNLLRQVLEGLHTAPFPVIAAVHGAALGAGTQLAMACDLRIATPDSTFGIPAAKLGLTVDFWTVDHLSRQAGASVARAMLLSAQVYSGEALHRSGFVQRLAEPGAGAVLDAALAWAADVAQLAPLTIDAHKLMLRLLESARADVPAEVTKARALAWSSADFQEGLAAFRERRRPAFRGA